MANSNFIQRFLIIFIFFLILISSNSYAEQKVLRWAADAEGNAPYIFQDPRVPTNCIGFEVDIANALAKEMNMSAQFVQNQWDGLIPGLFRGDYDVAINGIEITEDRKNEVNFSIPYYITFEQLVVMKAQESINSFSDLVGRKVGALKNSLAERILIAKQGIEVLSYEGEVNALQDMENGRIEAVLCDAPIALYYQATNPQFKLVGQPIGEVSYGIAIKKTDTELLNKINDAIAELAANGKLREIYQRWNLWNYMMGVHFNDKSLSNVPPTEFQKYLNSQGQKPTFNVLLKRYISYLPSFGEAALKTLEISILSMIVAILVGLIIALIRVYAPKAFSKCAVFYIETIRGTPLLIQLFFIYYALPSVLGIHLAPFIAAIIGLGLNYSAYEAENYRAGLFSVPRGQMEAAISLGMNRTQALRHIILPQAIRLVIPPMTNDFISLLKDSSLVSVITMVELTKLYNQLSTQYFDFFGWGIIVAIIYLLIGLPFVKLSKMAERRFAVDKRKLLQF
jgi:polar amino acid transport system substrate-binding protein